MELRIIFFMLFILSSGIFHTVVPASLEKTRAVLVSTRHSRPKRCSCATFLDKECVYFCHLDIIWVNTPERTVSYGLGNAPRKRRSAQEMSRAAERPRCECSDSADGTCISFCHTHSPQRREAARDTVFSAAGDHECAGKNCILDLTTKTSGNKNDHKRDKPSVTRATRWLQQLLKQQRRLAHSKQNLAAEKGTS